MSSVKYFILFVIIFSSRTALSNKLTLEECFKSFAGEPDLKELLMKERQELLFNKLIELESKAVEILKLIDARFKGGSSYKLVPELYQILNFVQNVNISKEIDAPEINRSYHLINNRLEEIKEELNQIDRQEPPIKKAPKQSDKQKTTSIEKLLESPESILADYGYEVKFSNNTDQNVFKIYFNKKVVKKLMEIQTHQLEKILRTITKGYVRRAKQDTGIKFLKEARQTTGRFRNVKLLELKTMGAVIGSIRIGGYLEGGNIFFNTVMENVHHPKVTERFKISIFKNAQR